MGEYRERPQIYAVFPSDKVGLFFEDATHLDTPKIRVALVPTAKGQGGPVSFWLDLHEARVLFADLRHGSLGALATKENKQRKDENGFDRFAKMGTGHRTLTIKNKPSGIGIKVVNKNGLNLSQVAYLSAWQTRVMAEAVSAYIAGLDVVAMAARALDRKQAQVDAENGVVYESFMESA